jgi:predicted enzyme related to lactoylglutathione lyase
VSLAIDSVLIDCNDLQRMSQFWRSALNLEHVWTGPSGGYLLIDAQGTTRLGLMPSSEEKGGKNRVHLDLRPDDQETEIQRLEELGAVRVDVGQRAVPWVVMADPEGNEFCVLRSR